MQSIHQDIRYAIRTLLRSPGFTVVSVLALALGIGANTAIFSVVNAVLLRPLPYASADRLVQMWEQTGPNLSPVPYPDYLDWREQSNVFDEIAAHGVYPVILAANNQPAERIALGYVSSGFLRVFQVHPLLGRDFSASDDSPGAPLVAILSHAFWKRQFGGDRGVIGKTVALDRRDYTIIGVLPPKFRAYRPADVYATIAPVAARFYLIRGNHDTLDVVGRRKSGASLEQVRAQMRTIAKRLEKQYPGTNTGVAVSVQPLRDALTGESRKSMFILLGAVGFVLLIACVNVANLLLARGTSRRREIAIRSALGAGRGRVIRQLLTESCLLGATGGALGLLLARLTFVVLVRLVPSRETLGDLALDFRVLLFAAFVSLATGLLFGIAPALQISRFGLGEALKAGGTAEAGAHGKRLRRMLVAGEVGLAFVLLAGAGLLLRTFASLLQVDPGFRTERILTMRVTLAESGDMAMNYFGTFYQRVLERVEALPGVVHAGVCRFIPLSGSTSSAPYYRDDRPAPQPGQYPEALWKTVSPGFFRALGIPLMKGRFFTPADGVTPAMGMSHMESWFEQVKMVAVISKSMADHAWPGEEPIGKRFRFGTPELKGPWVTILGVVGDTKHWSLNDPSPPAMYFPVWQWPDNGLYLTIRTKMDPLSLASAVRAVVHETDRSAPVTEVRAMEDLVSDSLSDRRLKVTLLGLLAGLALALAAVGIYGVMAYAVAQRTREIGLRMAIGASGASVMRAVLKEAGAVAVAGVAIGAAGALALTRFIAGFLYGVKASDPLTLAATAGILVSFAMLASYVPARRAMRVDPIIALRGE
jgi:putative ABC transport system permease protein